MTTTRRRRATSRSKPAGPLDVLAEALTQADAVRRGAGDARARAVATARLAGASTVDVLPTLAMHGIRGDEADAIMRRAAPLVRAGARMDGLMLVLRGVIAAGVGTAMVAFGGGRAFLVPLGAFAIALVCIVVGLLKLATGVNVR